MNFFRKAALVIAGAGLTLGVATLPSEGLTPPPGATTGLSQLRQDTVNRAYYSLDHGFKFRTGGVEYTSNTSSYTYRNLLERNGSNSNSNAINGFSGQEWCGYYAAYAWTGKFVPSTSDYPRIPTSYPSSQAWDWGNRTNFVRHSSSPGARPIPGDVLVWTNNDASTGGHVAVVVGWNSSTGVVTTIEGNVNGDEIARKTYQWTSNGPVISGKWFRGITRRE